MYGHSAVGWPQWVIFQPSLCVKSRPNKCGASERLTRSHPRAFSSFGDTRRRESVSRGMAHSVLGARNVNGLEQTSHVLRFQNRTVLVGVLQAGRVRIDQAVGVADQ